MAWFIYLSATLKNSRLNSLSFHKDKNLGIALAGLLANIETKKATLSLIGFCLVQSRKNHHLTRTNRKLGIDGTLQQGRRIIDAGRRSDKAGQLLRDVQINDAFVNFRSDRSDHT